MARHYIEEIPVTDESIPEAYRGVKILHDPLRNKGTAFTEAEREALGLRGLLPPKVHSHAEQELRVLGALRSKVTDLERYLYLMALQDRNETLFFRVVINHIEEMMPLIYTPTVGQACQEFGHIYQRPRGLYVSLEDRGRVKEVLENWPHRDARIIVVTDGERILGLGDLGSNGMGIPIGKLALYTACAGVNPAYCLPVMLDVGTDNETLLNDPLYNGLERRRSRGPRFDALVEEFVTAAEEVFPGVLIQLEDFGNANAFKLLERYRDRTCLFDDDIQGTGAVTLAGILAALRITGETLADQRILFLGAGEAGIGIADSVVAALVDEGMDAAEARKRCWFMDSRGLLVTERGEVAASKRPYVQDHPFIDSFLEAVNTLEPTAIVGISGQPATFTREVIESMARINDRPIIFALSNPTSKSECTAEQAYIWSEGRAIFASGSPFDTVIYQGQKLVPGQGNNAYIFPGVGLGVIASRSRRVTDEMFLAAARTLAGQVNEADLEQGRIYPPLSRIRYVSAAIAKEVATIAYREGLADREEPADIQADVYAQVYKPVYPHYA